MKRLNASVVVYISLVFLSGVLVGGVGSGLYRMRSVSATTNPCTPQDFRQSYIEEMQTRLNLRPEQVDDLEIILDESAERYRQLREKFRPDVKLIQDDQADKIRAMLNDAQRSEYEKMREEREKRRLEGPKEGRKHRSGPGSRP